MGNRVALAYHKAICRISGICGYRELKCGTSISQLTEMMGLRERIFNWGMLNPVIVGESGFDLVYGSIVQDLRERPKILPHEPVDTGRPVRSIDAAVVISGINRNIVVEAVCAKHQSLPTGPLLVYARTQKIRAVDDVQSLVPYGVGRDVGKALRLALVFVVREEVKLVLDDRTAKCEAQLLVRIRQHRLVDRIGRIEYVISEVACCASQELIRA